MLPVFAALVGGLTRRVNALTKTYGVGDAELDLEVLLAAAEQVALASSDLRWVEQEHYSVRQRKHNSLASIVGAARYVGAIGPFRQLLVLGMLVHCGKGTVFGNGRYRLNI
ncbi:MAG: CRISPR system precrRNA processing endoribonuclease RAMP protein Cas6 [Roseiflexaceae bacterium]|mgnify:CR=1 FL=1|nr:CRISPR system precrRNA processing endoribonuclease RAMP protein Cas6 [Roseiflexaceae bacterium]